MVPNIVKIYNKSDFTIQVPLADGYDNQEFRFTIYTCGEIENGWVASYINGNYTNCSVTEDIVTIFVDNNNNINPGCVTVQSEYDFSNHHFLDDEDNVKDNFKTNIYLVNYETNAFSAMYRPSNLPDLSETTDFVTWPEIEEELAYYVTFTYLNTYNYITEEYLDNTLDNYITEEQLSEYDFLTHSDLDNMSYSTESYVTSKLAGKQDMLINGINIKSVNGYSLVGSGNVEITFPEVDLSGYVTYSSLQTYLGSYVTKYDLSQAGYLTSNDISSLITSDDVYDILAESSYITSRTLSDMGYVTNQVLEQTLLDAAYVTQDDVYSILNESSYLTQNDISSMSYVTQSELNNASYATTSYVENYVATYGGNVDLSAYVTKDELNQAGYITMSDVSACGYITSIPSEYITESELDSMSYATITYVSEYVNTYAPTPDLSAYVTKDELNQAGYISSIPSNYATYDAISQMGYITSIPSEYITESELEGMSYATTTYVADYVNTHSGPIDLSAYVTKDELNQAGYISSIPSEYITESELDSMSYLTQNNISNMSYATTTYVENYVNTHSGPIDLSAYVTKDELNQAGYLTSIPSEYITESELDSMSYATTTYVEQYVTTYAPTPDLSAYVTKTELDQAGYITSSSLPDMSSYVTKSELDNAGYLTSIPSDYATYDAISAMGYITMGDVSACGYITSIPSEYITESELEGMSYVTQSELNNASYATTSYVENYVTTYGGTNVQEVTQAEYDAMEQAGTLDPDTIYIITDAQGVDLSYYATYSYLEAYYATQSYVSEYVNTYAPTPDLSAYVTKTELNNAGYITMGDVSACGYITSSSLPDMSSYVTKTELDSMSYITQTQLSSNSYINEQYLDNVGYTTAYVLTQNQYDGLSQSDKEKETIYIISDQNTYMNNELVTESSLDSRGFLTAANFSFDATTGTLTLNI